VRRLFTPSSVSFSHYAWAASKSSHSLRFSSISALPAALPPSPTTLATAPIAAPEWSTRLSATDSPPNPLLALVTGATSAA